MPSGWRWVLPLLAVAVAALMRPAGAQSCKPVVADSDLVKPGRLVMATNPTLPPMQFVTASGELTGMRIRLGDEIARRLCLTPEYSRVEFVAMIPGLRSGRWDVINTGIFWNPERAKIMQMVPYEQQAISVSVVKGNPLGISRPEDLAGRTVGVELGGFEADRLNVMDRSLTGQGLKAITIRTFDNFATAYQALAAGQLDAVVAIDPTAAEYAGKGRFDRPLHGLYPTPLALAMQSKGLAEAIVLALDAMQADGSYGRLMAEYGLIANSGPFMIKGP